MAKKECFSDSYKGQKWITVPEFKVDPKWTMKERFDALKRHHNELRAFLISEVYHLALTVDDKNDEIEGLHEDIDDALREKAFY
jgi:hypothetical protein